MPLWTIHHSTGVFTDPDRRELAGTVTGLYTLLPRFYVGVVFNEVPAGSFYVGGEPAERFVRIAVEHIARTLPNPESRTRWMGMVHEALVPFMAGRGLDWEIHIDETRMDLWSIQGLRPPPPDSAAERQWIRENRPTPYESRPDSVEPDVIARWTGPNSR
jgi:phenylpyruvate tautomerase PptA (4-oxalocrotonate tautomerase family)